MRTASPAIIIVATVLAVASPAAAFAIATPEPAPARGTELARGGCGPGWHPVWWRDRWGRPHRRCMPNRYYY